MVRDISCPSCLREPSHACASCCTCRQDTVHEERVIKAGVTCRICKAKQKAAKLPVTACRCTPRRLCSLHLGALPLDPNTCTCTVEARCVHCRSKVFAQRAVRRKEAGCQCSGSHSCPACSACECTPFHSPCGHCNGKAGLSSRLDDVKLLEVCRDQEVPREGVLGRVFSISPPNGNGNWPPKAGLVVLHSDTPSEPHITVHPPQNTSTATVVVPEEEVRGSPGLPPYFLEGGGFLHGVRLFPGGAPGEAPPPFLPAGDHLIRVQCPPGSRVSLTVALTSGWVDLRMKDRDFLAWQAEQEAIYAVVFRRKHKRWAPEYAGGVNGQLADQQSVSHSSAATTLCYEQYKCHRAWGAPIDPETGKKLPCPATMIRVVNAAEPEVASVRFYPCHNHGLEAGKRKRQVALAGEGGPKDRIQILEIEKPLEYYLKPAKRVLQQYGRMTVTASGALAVGTAVTVGEVLKASGLAVLSSIETGLVQVQDHALGMTVEKPKIDISLVHAKPVKEPRLKALASRPLLEHPLIVEPQREPDPDDMIH